MMEYIPAAALLAMEQQFLPMTTMFQPPPREHFPFVDVLEVPSFLFGFEIIYIMLAND